jgi:hypothetical protein
MPQLAAPERQWQVVTLHEVVFGMVGVAPMEASQNPRCGVACCQCWRRKG